MKKLFTTIFIFTFPLLISAQTELNEVFPLKNEERVSLTFEYPQLVKLKTWDKNEVAIKVNVVIDDGNQDEKFSFSSESKGGTFYLRSKLDEIEHRGNYRVVSSDEDDDQVTIRKNGNSIIVNDRGSSYHNGVEIDITVEVTVPEGMDVDVVAKYGMVEIQSIPKGLNVVAKFGGVDLSVDSAELKALDASTSWGLIYTDLTDEMQLSGDDMMGKEMKASISSKGSKKVHLDTSFGNVYIRKK